MCSINSLIIRLKFMLNNNAPVVYRVVSQERANYINVGDVINSPVENPDFVCSPLKMFAEDCFERVRLEVFESCPSRKSCLFVLPHDCQIVDQWVFEHYPHSDWNYVLLTLKLDGELIWCDEDIYSNFAVDHSSNVENSLAQQYWVSANSADYSMFLMPEGLFVGRALVLKKEDKQHKGIQ